MTIAGTERPVPYLDHIVWAAPDLATGVAHFETLTGIRATPGGRHSSGGTENALVSLGGSTYLEIVAPVPGTTETGRWLSFCRTSVEPRILTYCMRAAISLDELAGREAAAGRRAEGPYDLNRRRPDGQLLSWKLLDVDTAPFDRAVPFFIDWLESPHPSASAVGGVTLERFEVGYAEPEALVARLRAIGVSLPVVQAPQLRFEAVLASPKGEARLS